MLVICKLTVRHLMYVIRKEKTRSSESVGTHDSERRDAFFLRGGPGAQYEETIILEEKNLEELGKKGSKASGKTEPYALTRREFRLWRKRTQGSERNEPKTPEEGKPWL